MTISDTDRALAIAKHISGDHFIIEYASVWQGEECVGTTITAVSDALHYTDLGLESWVDLVPGTATFDRIANFDGELSDEAADWANKEGNKGRLTYPIGTRV